LPQQARKPRTFHSFKPIELSDEEEEDIKPTLSDLEVLSHLSSVPPLPRFPSDVSILEISDDSVSSFEQADISNRKRKRKPTKARCHTKRRASTPAPPPESSDVEVSGSESPSFIGDDGPQREALGKKKGKRVADTRIPITRQQKVEKLVTLDYLPSYYPIQEDFAPGDVAYLVQAQGQIKNGSMESALKDQARDPHPRYPNTAHLFIGLGFLGVRERYYHRVQVSDQCNKGSAPRGKGSLLTTCMPRNSHL
jgi:hypothetical protein